MEEARKPIVHSASVCPNEYLITNERSRLDEWVQRLLCVSDKKERETVRTRLRGPKIQNFL